MSGARAYVCWCGWKYLQRHGGFRWYQVRVAIHHLWWGPEAP